MSPYGFDTRPSNLPHVTFCATGDYERYWVSPSLPRCRVAGTRWLDDGVVGRGSNGEGLLGEGLLRRSLYAQEWSALGP